MTQSHDQIKNNYYESTKHLRDHFNDHKSTSADVEAVLDRASRIDSFMRRNRTCGNAMNDWSRLKGNLDELASIYNVSWRWGY